MDIDYILDIAARSISSKGRKKRNGGSIILFYQNEEKKSLISMKLIEIISRVV